MLDMDIANASTKQKGEVEGAENDCEEEGKSTECISHSVVLQCVDILVDWVRDGSNTVTVQPLEN